MEILIVLLAMAAIAAWLLWKTFFGKPAKSSPAASSRPDRQGPSQVLALLPQAPTDLTVRDGIRTRIAGSSHWVDDATLRQFNGTVFWLKREPHNRYDSNAIAVYGGDRKVGYVPATTAVKYAPLLDEIGSEFVVTRDINFYAGDEFYLPRIPALRKIAGAGGEVFDWEAQPLVGERPKLTNPPATLTGGNPKVGGPHRNGDRIYGYQTGYARDLEEAGTPTISKLVKRTVTPAISAIRIGDKLPLVHHNGAIWAEKDGELVGQLSWTWDHLTGVMEVQRVFISHKNEIVNCAGIAIPDKW